MVLQMSSRSNCKHDVLVVPVDPSVVGSFLEPRGCKRQCFARAGNNGGEEVSGPFGVSAGDAQVEGMIDFCSAMAECSRHGRMV